MDTNDRCIKSFWRSYIFAACITGLFTVRFIIPVVVLVLPRLVDKKRRVQVGSIVAILFTCLFMFPFVFGLIIIASVDSLSDFEGPNGEGSPIAPVIGMTISLLFVIPWVLAAMRGHKALKAYNLIEEALNHQKEINQESSADQSVSP